MILYPAIDIKDGACVRLEQGDMGRATVFHHDPAAQARAFAALGFRWPAFLVYCSVALWWFIPDLRIVRALEERREP